MTQDAAAQSTEDVAESLAPEGVGETSPGTAHGEDQKAIHGKEAGRFDEGTEGDTDRPVGSSDERDLTGI